MSDFDVRAFERLCRKALPELATFKAACESASRRRAGSEVGKGGSSVGKCISRLEAFLHEELNGGSLVDHTEPRKVCPTEAGEAFYRYCGDIASLSARFLDNLEYLQRGSEIRLAMTHSAWLAYGSDLEKAYKRRRPEGVVNFGDTFYSRDRVWDDIEREVLEGRADVGVYSFPPSRKKRVAADLAVIDWVEEEIVLVLPARPTRYARGTVVSIADPLLVERVVHYSRPLGFDRTLTIEAYLKAQKTLKLYRGDWLLGVNTISEIKETLRQKGGMSFLPWPTVAVESGSGALRAYRIVPPMRPRLMKIVCRLHTSRPAVRDFLKAAATLRGPRTLTT
jgi:DNA-binding transcriptional LysR family regulator